MPVTRFINLIARCFIVPALVAGMRSPVQGEHPKQKPLCPREIYSGPDLRLKPEILGRLPSNSAQVVGYEIINDHPVVATPHLLLAFGPRAISELPITETVKSISVDAQSRLLLQTNTGVKEVARTPRDFVPSRLTSTVRGRLYDSGDPVFVEVRSRADSVQFVARRPDSTPFLITTLKGKFRTASWNKFGLSAVVGDSLIVWEPGHKEVLQLLDDKGLRQAADVCLVGPRRVVVTLQNVALLVTPRSLSILLYVRSARCRFHGGSLYLLEPSTRVLWELTGIDRIGDPSQDRAYALALLHRLPKPVDTSKPQFGEAVRILGCKVALHELSSTSGK